MELINCLLTGFLARRFQRRFQVTDAPRRVRELRLHRGPSRRYIDNLAVLLNTAIGVESTEDPLRASLPLAARAEVVVRQRAVHILDRLAAVNHLEIDSCQSVRELDVLDDGAERLIKDTVLRDQGPLARRSPAPEVCEIK